MVKSFGSDFEKPLPELVRLQTPALPVDHPLQRSLSQTLQPAPSSAIRGAARRILRGVIVRGLGLR